MTIRIMLLFLFVATNAIAQQSSGNASTNASPNASIDPEHIFYLESRGIPHAAAERMIVHGFFGQVLDRIPVGQARDLVEHELETRIG